MTVDFTELVLYTAFPIIVCSFVFLWCRICKNRVEHDESQEELPDSPSIQEDPQAIVIAMEPGSTVIGKYPLIQVENPLNPS